jgi:outer membrane lipoprotein-sorting protein
MTSPGYFLKTLTLLLFLGAGITRPAAAQAQKSDANQVFYQLRDKMNSVHDYVADVRLKIDVKFMRVPLMAGKLYFKSPGKLRLERGGGISVMPHKSINLSIDKMMPTGGVTVIDAGTDQIDGRQVRILKVIPDAEGDIVLTKVWVDEARLLALRTETTTRENGTVKTELTYGKYEKQALPDRILFVMDVKEYKLPKGVTMDYDEGKQETPTKGGAQLPTKGRIEIRYLNYQINTGLSDSVFK